VYTEFFALSEKPFSITPDPRYLYMSRRHADALAHLIYGISESGGFIQLTGEVGTGKTTLIRSLLEQLPAKAEIALILNPQLSTKEFLQVICEELRAPPPADDSGKARIDSLNAQLLKVHAEDRRVVLIVDEAQTLSPELLEQVRLLTNLETAKQKLLQIILIGQPELREILDRPQMRQIAQRVTGRYHLEPLSAEDTAAYVRHRMKVAGAQTDVFTGSALRALYRTSRGIPRLINVIADRALLAAYTRDRHTVDGRLVASAAREVFGRRRPAGRWWPWLAAGIGLASFALATTNLWDGRNERSRKAATLAALVPLDVAPLQVSEATDAVPAAAVPAPPAPAAPALPKLGELMQDPDFATDTDTALAQLFALWNETYDPARGDPCAQAVEHGLACLFQQRGSLSELRLMNRPAILSLLDERGQARQIVISALGYDEAQLAANGKVFEIPLAELTYYWFGDHLLLWRPGIAPQKDLVPGMRDDAVLWLRETLGRIRGETAPTLGDASLFYDTKLETQVREYQRARMLTVDGIVGARTQIAITTEVGAPPLPRLLASH
jgi:general secretion pathway protein A